MLINKVVSFVTNRDARSGFLSEKDFQEELQKAPPLIENMAPDFNTLAIVQQLHKRVAKESQDSSQNIDELIGLSTVSTLRATQSPQSTFFPSRTVQGTKNFDNSTSFIKFGLND